MTHWKQIFNTLLFIDLQSFCFQIYLFLFVLIQISNDLSWPLTWYNYTLSIRKYITLSKIISGKKYFTTTLWASVFYTLNLHQNTQLKSKSHDQSVIFIDHWLLFSTFSTFSNSMLIMMTWSNKHDTLRFPTFSLKRWWQRLLCKVIHFRVSSYLFKTQPLQIINTTLCHTVCNCYYRWSN